MDIGVILGIGGGLVLTAIGIVWGGGSLLAFFDPPSLMITVGASFLSLFVAYPVTRVLQIVTFVRLALTPTNFQEERLITRLVAFSEKARREGLLALEDDLEEIEDGFLRQGIQLVVDGTDPEIIKNILYNELNQIQARHQAGIMVITDWSTQAPAFGMFGTILGLIILLGNIEDRSTIGKGMAVALLTTFYGIILSYLVFGQIRKKLEGRDGDEALVREIMVEGVLSIQSGDNPRILEEKLLCFLPPARREAVRQAATGPD
jgi:chemotaxis protein MotA